MFDEHEAQFAQQMFDTSIELTRPSVIWKPKLSLDGNQYCALYGDDLQSGIAGFGDTAHKAMLDFDKNWFEQQAPQASKSPPSKSDE